MPNNLTANIPFSGTASQTVPFSEIPEISSASIRIIYKVGNPLKSFIPGRSINGISGFEAGAGYYIIPKTSIDLNFYFLNVMPLIQLTDLPTISWNVAVSPSARVAISGVRSIDITNVQDGDRGVLQVEHITGGSSINLPGAKADGFAWKLGAGNITVLGFIYTAAKGFLWVNDGFTTT